jgi:Legionella pneumophila major outer membrane protein precursor
MNMMSSNARYIRNTLAGGVVGMLLLGTASAQAADTAPSNEELYNMVLGLQAKQEQLQNDALEAKKQAADSQQKLTQSQRELDLTKQQLQSAQEALSQHPDENTDAAQASVHQALESAAPQAILGAAPMPPSGAGQGLFIRADVGATRIRGADTPYAALRGRGGEIPLDKWQTVDVDWTYSIRPEIGYYLPGGNGIVSASYVYANAMGKASTFISTANPNGPLVGAGNLGPFDEDSIYGAQAENKIWLDQFDGQYMYPIKLTKTFNLIPEFGVRYVMFKNLARIQYFEDDGTLSFINDFTSESSGVGPKIALGSSWELMKDLTLSVKAGGGVLIGRNDASRSCQGPVRCENVTNHPRAWNRDERSFPFVSGDFSLQYAVAPVPGLSIGLGYRVESFFGLLTQMRDVAAFEPRQDVFEHRNVTYDSFHLGATYLW